MGLVAQAIVDAVLLGAIYGLVAIGLGLIWGIADIVNFAHGSYLLIAMLVTIFGAKSIGIDPIFFLPINAVILFLLGYGTYKFIVSKVMDASMLSQIFVTFGLLLVIDNGILWLIGPSRQSVESDLISGNFQFVGVFVSVPKLFASVVSLLAIGLLFVYMKKSKTGKAIRATEQDWEAAQVIGIDTDYVLAMTWGIGIGAIGIAGTVIALFVPAAAESTGLTWGLIAFAAVALGGFGTVLGALFGGFALAVVDQFGVRLLNPSYKDVYIFTAFLIGILARQSMLPEIINTRVRKLWRDN